MQTRYARHSTVDARQHMQMQDANASQGEDSAFPKVITSLVDTRTRACVCVCVCASTPHPPPLSLSRDGGAGVWCSRRCRCHRRWSGRSCLCCHRRSHSAGHGHAHCGTLAELLTQRRVNIDRAWVVAARRDRLALIMHRLCYGCPLTR